MDLLNQKITCPFCFSAFSPQELRFRCVGPSCSGRAPDAIYATARGYGVTQMGRVLIPTKRAFGLPRVAICDACKTESRTRICPVCHFELSHDVGQIDQCIIAIIGDTSGAIGIDRAGLQGPVEGLAVRTTNIGHGKTPCEQHRNGDPLPMLARQTPDRPDPLRGNNGMGD